MLVVVESGVKKEGDDCLLFALFVFYQKGDSVVNIHRIIDTADEITALLSKRIIIL